MYQVETHTYTPDDFISGSMPIAREALGVTSGETIKARSLITIADGKAKAYTAENATKAVVPYGIAAADAENDRVVVYMTGEFDGSKLVLPDTVELSTVAPLLRSNGIFLKNFR